MNQLTTQLNDLKHHLTEALRYLENIETSAFPGLDCALMEVQAAQESVQKMMNLIKEI